MQHIVKIQNKNIGAETNSVNARELHTFIQAKQEFANWIKNRINKYNFKENQDYIIITTSTGGRPSKEYYITLDMAKELSMVENNDKGREARRWFIEVAKKYQNNQDKNTPYIYQLERENTELRRAINRLSIESHTEEFKRLQDENKHIKRTLIQLHDNYHNIVIKSQEIEVVKKELWQITNRFQLISDVEHSGQNLNTQTVAKHSYWE